MATEQSPSTEQNGTHVLTPLGVLSLKLGAKQAQVAIDALVLHMARNYGHAEAPGVVLRNGQLFFTALRKA